jgi:hypothetical protein
MQAKKPSIAQHQAQQARFAHLNRVMLDVSIPLGARVLYWHLDSHARLDGRCWIKIPKLAALLGKGVRSVKDWLDELRRAGYIDTLRTRRCLVFQLCWFDVHQAAHQDGHDVQKTAADVQQAAHHEPLSLYETSFLETSGCDRCGGKGWYFEAAKRRGDTGLRVCGCTEITYSEAVSQASAAARWRA